MHSKIFSATTIGVNAHLVEVEVDLSYGLINFFIVGLPDTAIKESRQRVLTALKNTGIKMPERKITVNLAPADLKKEGTLFDLPIAIAIIQASKIIDLPQNFINETIFIGELSLDGSIKPIKGALPISYDAVKLNKKRIILPISNANEASLIKNVEIIGVKDLNELISFLRNEISISATICQPNISNHDESYLDFAQVKGQNHAKRALQISAAGNHNILFIGSPGAGKTMLAKRLCGIMPEMSFDEILETSKIYSISGKLKNNPLIAQRPFRSPHHTISQAGLVGGGSFPQPGEISLAHNGILFLDELTEFKRTTLEVLRQPLESKTVCIARANQTIEFPASFLLIAALNPCPCGYYGDKKKQCICSQHQIQNYMQKLSGPLIDRIDLQIYVQSIEFNQINQTENETISSKKLLEKVKIATHKQKNRFLNVTKYNSALSTDEIEKYCILSANAKDIIKKAFEKLNMSMRSYHKILKISRTIADLEDKDTIESEHIQEALMYRNLAQEFNK